MAIFKQERAGRCLPCPTRSHSIKYVFSGSTQESASFVPRDRFFSERMEESPQIITLAVYYILLAVLRVLLLWRWGGIGAKQELCRYRLCGVGLLIMNVALAGMVVLMVSQNRGYVYPGILIYAMAAYSFYTVIIAVVNVIKFRRHGSPVLSAAKTISLAAALVSILALETAMIAQFGGTDDYRKMMTAATGGGVCAIILGMAVFMIVRSAKHMKQLEIQER